MKIARLLLLPLAAALAAQAQQPAKKTDAKPAKEAAAKQDSQEANDARQQLNAVLDSVDAAWFGQAYKDVKAVDVDGTLSFTISASALNKKVEEASQGAVKGGLTKNGNATVRLKGTYFARGDFHTEFTGDFGSLLWNRVGNKGFIYSKEQGTYTTAVDLGPADAPLTWMTWFRECVQDIRKVYTEANTFKASLGKEETAGGRTLRTLIFQSPTAPYDPKKREQPLADSLKFWKRGHLELTYDKATKLPQTMVYTNVAQGIRSRMDFRYTAKNGLQSVTVNNQSKGFEGPGGLMIAYSEDGRMTRISGELNGSNDRKVAFNLGLAWAKDKSEASIKAVPPPNAKKMGGDEFTTMLLVASASQFMELQRYGWNVMAPKVAVAVSK